MDETDKDVSIGKYASEKYNGYLFTQRFAIKWKHIPHQSSTNQPWQVLPSKEFPLSIGLIKFIKLSSVFLSG